MILLFCIFISADAKFFEYDLPLPENVEGEDVTERQILSRDGTDRRFRSTIHHNDYFHHDAVDNEDVDHDDIDILNDEAN